MAVKIVTISMNEDSEQIMVHWPSGQVTFQDIGTFSRLFSFLWWYIKLQLNGFREGYRVRLILDGEEVDK